MRRMQNVFVVHCLVEYNVCHNISIFVLTEGKTEWSE